MRRAFASSVLSLLLLITLLGGGCISCEQYFMFGGAKSCCSSDGHCKTKTPPTKKNPGRACSQIAFDHHKSIDQHIDLPIIAVAKMDAPPSAIESVERWHGLRTAEPSPPDLQVLYSIFLI